MSRMTENLNEKTQRANGKKGFFAKHFPPRDFLIRHEDDVRYFTLSTRTQALIFCVLSLCAVWLLFSSFFYVRYDRSVDAKDKQIALLQNAYKDVLKNVAAYEDYALRIEEQLDENHRQMLALDGNAREESVSETAVKKVEPFSLPEESEEEKEFKRLQEERSFLKAQASYVRQRLTTLARGAVSAFRPAEDAVSFKTALLQRDLATSEARELKQRVQDLEEMIAEMQDTQILAFQKMASLADGNITAIEDGLSDISETLKTAGLGMNSLLSRIRREIRGDGRSVYSCGDAEGAEFEFEHFVGQLKYAFGQVVGADGASKRFAAGQADKADTGYVSVRCARRSVSGNARSSRSGGFKGIYGRTCVYSGSRQGCPCRNVGLVRQYG